MAPDGGPVCISVINMKGGVGKTTLAALLARHAAQRFSSQVLAIDLDPQANLSQALMGEGSYKSFLDNKSPSIVEVFSGYQPPTANSLSTNQLNVQDIVHRCSPSNLRLIPSRFDFSDNLSAAVRPDPRCLARLIAADFQDRDLILIDCAPTESIFTTAAYHASRYVLVPVRPEFFATIGFPLLEDSLGAFRNSNRGHEISVLGVVINNATYNGGNDGGPEKSRAMDEIAAEAAKNNWHVFKKELGYSRGFPKLMRGDYNYSGSAPQLFESFAKEFFGRSELCGLRP